MLKGIESVLIIVELGNDLKYEILTNKTEQNQAKFKYKRFKFKGL